MLINSFLVVLISWPLFTDNLPMPKKNPHIPDAMLSPIKKRFSDFKVLSHLSFSREVLTIASHHPAKAIADFNDDGKKDALLYGYSKQHRKILIVASISQNNRYQAQYIHERNFIENQATTEFGNYINVGLKNPKQGRDRDIAQWEFFGKSAPRVDAFYYSLKENKFKPFIKDVD